MLGAGNAQVMVKKNNRVDLQVEGLVELWRPIAGLLFGLELPLLVRQMGTCSAGQHNVHILFFAFPNLSG